MKATLYSVATIVAVSAFFGCSTTQAQDNLWTGGVGGNWTDGTWNQFGPPLPLFDARGVIGSNVGTGSPIGEVNVPSDIRATFPSSTVVLGDGLDNQGTLNIAPAGALAVVLDGASTGDFDVGLDGGVGYLNVEGILEIDGRLSTPTSGSTDSTITLSGSAMLTAGSAFLDQQLLIDGSNVSAHFTGNAILAGSGTHTWRIPSTGASTIVVDGNADLGGTLKVAFPDGVPSVGTTWDLVDSATVDDGELNPSGFNAIDQSASGALPGQRFVVDTVPGGTKGNLTQLSLEQHPVLYVDRATGSMEIRNPGSGDTIAFDTYVVSSSNQGALNPANWNSLSPAGDWHEARPTVFDLSELKSTGSATVTAGAPIDLGTPYTLPTPSAFGEENEDIRFRFSKPGESVFTEGDVVYTGLPTNTLTLNVDPTTGEAQIVNGTAFTVAIDSYAVTSDTGSLNHADGNSSDTWNSLEDQATANWYEANVSEEQISELLVAGGMELAPGAVVNLGSPFNDATGIQDLEFQFALVASGASDGDFNGDGQVDAADYVVWRNNLGAADDSALNGNGDGVAGVDQSDYLVWKNNFGATSTPGSAGYLTGKVLYGSLVAPGALSIANGSSVPEPGSVCLGLLGIAAVGYTVAGQRKRRP